MKRTIISATLVIAAAVVAFAQEFKPIPNPPMGKTVAETLKAAGNFNTFLSLLEKTRSFPSGDAVRGSNNNAGIRDSRGGLKNLGFIPTDSGNAGTATPGTRYHTIFVPTDAAFAKLLKGTVEALKKDPARLRSFLLAHIVPGKVLFVDPTTDKGSITTVGDGTIRDFKELKSRQGSVLSFSYDGDTLCNPMINGKARVGKFRDVMAVSDFFVIIHEIDAVLFLGGI